MARTIRISVNGSDRDVAAGTTLAALVALLELDRTQVAVERNRDVVPRARYDEVALAEGDRIEVLTFVGGG